MSPSTPLLRPTTLAALVASALLGACGGGAGNAGSAFESAQFADASFADRDEITVNEAACLAPARWVAISAFGDDTLPLYPRDLIRLLTT